jgi:hypothetical protein
LEEFAVLMGGDDAIVDSSGRFPLRLKFGCLFDGYVGNNCSIILPSTSLDIESV